MFVDKKDILAQLAAGMDAEDIAQNLIDTLNEAISDYEEDRRQNAEIQKQRESAAILLSAFESYVMDYCPNIQAEIDNSDDDTSPEDIVDLMKVLDEAVHTGKETLNRLNELVDTLISVVGPTEQEVKIAAEPGTSPKLPENLVNFLEKNQLI